ncbi:MAG: hypothetical protein UT61_C0066G0016, partial [Candidatus Woesebacteria bacterium GW2011_GWA1_39_8]
MIFSVHRKTKEKRGEYIMKFKKSLVSLLAIGAVTIAGVAATRAFFSDTETSTGNTFEAGSIDLKVDNESFWNRGAEGLIAKRTDLSWEAQDLDGSNKVFFSYQDMKPGDLGEDTISLHTDNDAWVCASFNVTENKDNSCTEPELDDDP